MNTCARTLSVSVFASGLLAAGTATATAAWPERPITMIVPFSAGAGTDITARTVATCMESQIKGASIVVVNKPGASGDIGLSALAQSAPDGYTLGIVNTPGVVSIPIERSTKWSLDSFEFLGNVAEAPGTISVHADSAIRTIPDLVKAAKAAPGKVSVGTQGVGSAGHISMLLLEKSAGVELSPIPFQGAAPARTALLGKVIESTMANVDEAVVFRAGAPWRILGVMSDARSPVAPELPTFKEAGYDIRAGSMRGFAGPKGMPADVTARLSTAIKACADDATFRERAAKSYLPIRYLAPKDYMKSLQQLDASLRDLWKVKPWNQ
ncbi:MULTISPECIES: tripartite tricarboxylate transporter substrate binding protein [Ramlibacter]|uniref:Tripartite tricarboxylate transporter substrate binding protein n=1 Tax=Ramlibacter pinisoli TaxID=2682844 RepID=A0A6N8IRA0_9BURK|nr:MULTISPECIES: tripartite tricarboxylate transporter substrate binding protein [Ramlibacter]MBA2964455.1 tripartite tricarboxylate transporter substrate binding protein [Ramlibacter sp. CGMCC 1.13660]MVQ29421.1 tripartite tricarboxylate transporter substrate binding protein [Ramlibacter pinisoli]